MEQNLGKVDTAAVRRAKDLLRSQSGLFRTGEAIKAGIHPRTLCAMRETVKKRVDGDPDFAKALLHEAVNLMLDGDSATAKLILRDLINATVGFERLAAEVHKPSKSLHRMLSTSGNPTMENLSAIFVTILKRPPERRLGWQCSVAKRWRKGYGQTLPSGPLPAGMFRCMP